MKAVVIGESSSASRESIMPVYPRHKVVVDKFNADGVVPGRGPFSDGGNMAIFKTSDAVGTFPKGVVIMNYERAGAMSNSRTL
jgi:uncharacterized protein